MGNPDLATPDHIVDKLVEAAQKPHNHRYSASKGITKLRMAISDWYKRRYDVDIDPETEAIVTIGVKEGMSHLILCDHPAGAMWSSPRAPPTPYTRTPPSSPGATSGAFRGAGSTISSTTWSPPPARPGPSPRC